MMLTHHIDGLQACFRFAGDVQIRPLFEQHLQPFADQCMIVHHENINHIDVSPKSACCGVSSINGTKMAICVPLPRVLAILTVPPRCATRSCTPRKPNERGLLRAASLNPTPSSEMISSRWSVPLTISICTCLA